MTEDSLFTPLFAGAFTFPNRILMAPLTRCRASTGRVPNVMMAEYYTQRSSFGMILSEATAISPQGVGYPNTPGIWSDAQVAGWQLVTDAVHAAGGQILLQLWHVGSISDPIYLNGELPVSASAIAPEGHVSHVRPLKKFVTPRALELGEIPGIVADYRRAAENAKAAGFDGVEIHGANGYLIDQFLHASSNHRTDTYGGGIENRCRFLLEVTDAVIAVWGADRVGVHFAPHSEAPDHRDADISDTFHHAARELGKREIAFIFGREPYDGKAIGPSLKQAFGGVYIANQDFTAASAREAILTGTADAVAFGKAAIANPDLVERFHCGAELNVPNPATFYGDGPIGYTDYPFLETASV